MTRQQLVNLAAAVTCPLLLLIAMLVLGAVVSPDPSPGPERNLASRATADEAIGAVIKTALPELD